MTQSYFLREELVGYFVTHGFWYSVSSFNCLQFKSERARVESEEVIWGSESVRNTNVFSSNSQFQPHRVRYTHSYGLQANNSCFATDYYYLLRILLSINTFIWHVHVYTSVNTCLVHVIYIHIPSYIIMSYTIIIPGVPRKGRYFRVVEYFCICNLIHKL